jgi:hypothetical protein
MRAMSDLVLHDQGHVVRWLLFEQDSVSAITGPRARPGRGLSIYG